MKTSSFLAFALALFAGLCSAQTAYPSRAVKVIVPLAAGGPVDLVARRVSERLARQLGQPVAVENRAGGNGIIGANACKSAAPDGHTLCILLSDTLVINPAIYKKLPYTVGDFAPVSEISRIDTAVVVSARLPIRSIQELVQYDRAHPGQLNWGHFGIGSSSHLFMAQVNEKLGARIVDVPYQGGGPALNGLLGDQVQVSSLSYSLVAQHIDAGKLRALAVPRGDGGGHQDRKRGLERGGQGGERQPGLRRFLSPSVRRRSCARSASPSASSAG